LIDREIVPLYSDKARPGIETRFAFGLLLLKHIYGLSDEGVCERWIHDPYFQHFTGEEFFQHSFPHEGKVGLFGGSRAGNETYLNAWFAKYMRRSVISFRRNVLNTLQATTLILMAHPYAAKFSLREIYRPAGLQLVVEPDELKALEPRLSPSARSALRAFFTSS
jgi:hypothetical protein